MRNQKGENRVRGIMAGELIKETGRNLQKNKKNHVNGNSREHDSRPISTAESIKIYNASVNLPAKLIKLQQINRDVIKRKRVVENELLATKAEIKSLKAKHDLIVKDLKDAIHREKHEEQMEAKEFSDQFKETYQDWISEWRRASRLNRNLLEANDGLRQEVLGKYVKQEKLNLLLRRAKKMFVKSLDAAVQTV